MLCAALYTYYNFILYIKTHCQWITVEIHTVFNQSPKTLRWSVRQTQLLSKTVRILLVLFHPTRYNIILEYNFLLQKGLQAPFIIFVH